MSSIFLPFPWPLTTRQNIYLFGMQGIAAMCVDAGANFGIAYAMYHGQDVVKMWVFSKNTIAGDLGVTPFIQCAASMVITSTLVHTDLHHSAVKPLPFVYPHVAHLPDPSTFFSTLRRRRPSSEKADSSASSTTADLPRRSITFYWLMLVRFVFEGTEHNMLFDRSPPSAGVKAGGRVGRFFGRLAWTILQGLGLGLLVGFPLWCLAIVILGPIYQNKNMGNVWAPQAIKAVYGGILGLITNPIIATLALGSQAEHHLIPLAADANAPGASDTASGDAALTNEKAARDATSAAAPGLRVPPSPAGRTASLSSSRRRPSITANPSSLLVVPPAHPIGSSTTPLSFTSGISAHPTLPSPAAITESLPVPPATGPSTQDTPQRTPNRPRAHTGASEYSLGGTGGRAQRPRAGSRSSVRSVVPGSSPVDNVLLGAPVTGGRVRASSSAESRPLPSAWTATAPPASPRTAPAGVQRLRGEELEVPRESLELREGERERAVDGAQEEGEEAGR